MNIVSALLGSSPAPEQRSIVSSDELADLLAGPQTATGRTVTVNAALKQATVFACVRLISEAGAMIPLLLYRRLEPRGKERAVEHVLYNTLHSLPNPELTALELKENILGHICLWGNAFCEIEYDMAGRRRALWLLRPDRMTVTVNERNERVYVYTLDNGSEVPLARWRVWHIRGWGTDAWYGKSPITLARESIALATATEEYGARFFGNDSRPGGILTHPGKLSPEAAKKLKTGWEDAHRGLTNSQRVAVLEEGITWTTIGIPPNDAQFLETRAFQQTQICQIYRVPPHMISIVEKSTSWGTGIGQQTQAFVTFCLGPYLARIEQSVGRDLLTVAERKTYFAEHLSAALVKDDLASRTTAYNVGRMGGWLSVNDIREMENLNPVPDGDGYLQPLNMGPLGAAPVVSDAAQSGDDGGDDETQSSD
jgi:HK97 family phage portal protein